MKVKVIDSKSIVAIAENITRCLIGDTSGGLNNLKTLLSESPNTCKLSDEDYNLVFNEISNIFEKSLQKSNHLLKVYDRTPYSSPYNKDEF